MTHLVLVRHGITAVDVDGIQRFKGWWNVELSKQGLAQADRLAIDLAEMDVVSVYFSDLRRCATYAMRLATHLKLEVSLDDRLREQHLGGWEGCTLAELEHTQPDEVRRWRANPLSDVGGREPRTEFIRRVDRFLDNFRSAATTDGSIVVVTHSNVIGAVAILASGADVATAATMIPAPGRTLGIDL